MTGRVTPLAGVQQVCPGRTRGGAVGADRGRWLAGLGRHLLAVSGFTWALARERRLGSLGTC